MKNPVTRLATPVALFTGIMLAVVAFAAPSSEDPPEISGEQRAYALWQQGYLFHIRGDFEAAVVLFRRSIAVHPTAEGHTFLGWSLSKLGKIQEALSECKKAIAIDPEFGNPYNDIGVYLIDLGRPDEAVPWLEKATKAKRYCFYQFVHFNLGRVLLMQGKLEAARIEFQRSLRHDPDYVPAKMAIEYLDAEIGKSL